MSHANDIASPELQTPEVHVPTATYRLQFHHGFTFTDAIRLTSYLRRLGVTDIYSSPIWRARPGSKHCYDVTDHTQVNPELGGESALKELAAQAHKEDLGIIVDVVPNHMGILDINNRQWWDVLQNGQNSRYSDFFDIDWRAPKEELHDRIQIPTLGNQFGVCLEAGELKIRFTAAGEFIVQYYDKIFPTGPRTWRNILSAALESLKTELASDDWDLIELESIITALHNLPVREDTCPERTSERMREKEVCKRRLRTLVQNNPLVRRAVELAVEELNGKPGVPESFDALEAFLNDQAFRLSFWRTASDEINYRRFFDVNELAAIRVEQPEVFHHVHDLIFRLISDGIIRGLRIDHPDGLLNPSQYFQDLQQGCYHALYSDTAAQVPMRSCTETPCSMYVVVEKILAHKEQLRPDWAVHGTTGYEYLNLLNGIFVDTAAAPSFSRLYSRFIGEGANFPKLMHECKKLILDISMTGELVTLARKLDRVSEQNRLTRDFTLGTLQEALAEFIACFPVYRSYIRPDSNDVDEHDLLYIQQAIRTAKKRNPSTDPTIFDFIGSLVLLDNEESYSEEERQNRREFVLRLQQITGPVMAKGLEDTAFYRDHPLASLNEVGGEPERFGTPLTEFHQRAIEQSHDWPFGMLSTSTHDTKRSEDVRARLNVLSEIPAAWEKAISRWRRLNNRRKRQVEGIHVPTTRDEYLLYQTLLGVWPLHDKEIPGLTARVSEYMIKAVREAKIHTSWINVNSDYEDALTSFIQDILSPQKSAKFLNDLQNFVRPLAIRGAGNSLSQVLLKTTSPGVPDYYQGQELWDFSLVDPDNRRPVDYDHRAQLLDELLSRQDDRDYIQEVQRDWQGGRIKLLITHRTLAFRRVHKAIFLGGSYTPLQVEGPQSECVIAFARTDNNGTSAVSIAPRLLQKHNFPPDRLADPAFWSDTYVTLPATGTWNHIFAARTINTSDTKLPLSEILGDFPVALLSSQ